MLLLYNAVLLSFLLLLSPFIAFKLITDKRYRSGLSERMGVIPRDTLASLDGHRPIWFHAASVGEVISSQQLLEGIREKWPDKKLLVSAFTPTGKETAVNRLKADGVIFIPLDIPWVVKKVMKRINPAALVLMETELWPNLIRQAGVMRIPVVVVNGRISDRSYGKYWFISPLLKKVFDNVASFLMQSEGDAERIMTLGADRSKVHVTGNLKFDLKVKDNKIGFMDEWNGHILVFGSTHGGEDSPLLDLYKELTDKHRGLKLIIVPRHLTRVKEVEGLLEEKRLLYTKRSMVSDRIGSNILLLDTLGELTSFYNYGDAVFIGGSLVPAGGHNLLEPALLGKPVLFGPHIENFKEAARILIDSGGGIKVTDITELKEGLDKLISDSALCRSMGDKARHAVLNKQGATDKTLEELSKLC